MLSLLKPGILFVLGFLFIAGAAYLVVRLKWQTYLFKLIALLLPFSIEKQFTGNAAVLFPGEILIGIAAFSIILEFIIDPSSFRKFFNGEVLFAIPFLIVFVISAMFSSMPVVSVKYILINITYLIVLFFIMKKLLAEHSQLFGQLITLYSLSFSVIIAYAAFRFMQYGYNPVVTKGIFQPFYKDHTITGASAAILSAYWFAKASGKGVLTIRIMMASAGFFFLFAVFLTHSRAAILSMVFFAFIWVILKLKINYKYLISVFVALLFLGIVFHQKLYDRLYYNKYVSRKQNIEWQDFIKSAGNVTTDDSNVERLNRWYSGIKMFFDRPLTGFGPGTYQFMYIPYQKKELTNRLTVKNYNKIPENSGGTAHSEYILALSEMGFPGFAALLLLFGRWIHLVFVKSSSHRGRENIIVAFVAISTYLFHSLFNNFLNTDKFAFLFWGMAAYLLSVYEQKNDYHGQLL